MVSIVKGFTDPLILIDVDDINTRVASIKQAGGSVVLEPQTLTDMNMIWAIMQDTEGNTIGLTQNL